MDRVPVNTVLLFTLLFATALWITLWLLQRGTHMMRIKHPPVAQERRRIAHLLQDDIGQKIAAACVNLSDLRLQLRKSGVPESAELDAAMNLLDDGCRDLRTVSRLMKGKEAEHASTGRPKAIG